MNAPDLSSFSKDQFAEALSETLAKLLVNKKLHLQEGKKAFLLGGQSGAGKTTLHRVIGNMLGGNVVIVNGDEFRKSHPNFDAIQERYGVDAPSHTAKWAGQMTEALIDALSGMGYNLVIEGTLRTSDVPLRTAGLLKGRGYSVSLAIMAVKPEISLVSCQIRYEMMRIASTVLRATDPAHHNKIVRDIVANLELLQEFELFDDVLIYDRAERRLFPPAGACGETAAHDANGDAIAHGACGEPIAHGSCGDVVAHDVCATPVINRPAGDAPNQSVGCSASQVLNDVLFGSWTREEELHYRHLQRRLEELRAQ